MIVVVAGEGYNRLIGAVTLGEQLIDFHEIVDGSLNAGGDDHCAGLAAYLVGGDVVEVFHHHFGLFAHRLGLTLDKSPQFLHRLAALKHRVALDGLADAVVALIGGVTFEHVEDEALLDGLTHRIDVERAVPHLAVGLGEGHAEGLQRLVLGRGGEGVEVGVGSHFAPLGKLAHRLVDAFLLVVVIVLAAEYLVGVAGHASALAAVGLVDDHGEVFLRQVAHLVHDKRKLVNSGEDDALAALKQTFQRTRTVGPVHDVLVAGERAHVVAQLLVEVHTVGDEDDAVKLRVVAVHHLAQLIGQPRDAVALAAAGAVLDEVTLAHGVLRSVGKQPAHALQLVVAWPDGFLGLFLGLGVNLDGYLGIVLQNLAQPGLGEDVFPQVGCAQSIRVDGVAGTVVAPLVEGQEPAVGTAQLGAHLHVGIVHCQMHGTSLVHEQQVLRVAVGAILAHGIGGGLHRERVLQLHRDDGQAVDQQHHIYAELGVARRVMQLANDGELVQRIHLLGCVRQLVGVRRIEHKGGVGQVLDALAQHVHHAAVGNLLAHALQELAAVGRVVEDARRAHQVGLGGTQKCL